MKAFKQFPRALKLAVISSLLCVAAGISIAYFIEDPHTAIASFITLATAANYLVIVPLLKTMQMYQNASLKISKEIYEAAIVSLLILLSLYIVLFVLSGWMLKDIWQTYMTYGLLAGIVFDSFLFTYYEEKYPSRGIPIVI